MNNGDISSLYLVGVVGGVVLASSESQLRGANVEHSDDILLEGVAQNVEIFGGVATTVNDTGNADGVALVVGASIEDHVEGVDVEGLSADGDAVSGRGGVAVYNVGALLVRVSRRRGESGVDLLSDGSWVVVQGGARIDLHLLDTIR